MKDKTNKGTYFDKTLFCGFFLTRCPAIHHSTIAYSFAVKLCCTTLRVVLVHTSMPSCQCTREVSHRTVSLRNVIDMLR